MLECLGGRCREAGPGKKEFLRDDARRWFFGQSDFEWWCEMAGFDLEYVREKARKVIENGLPDSSMMRQGCPLPSMTAEERRLYRNAYQRRYNARKRRG
jgi:hypothetical protein